MSERVVLAMSGGVDSSAAAHLLLEQGYEVIGLFMRSGATEETACAIEDPHSLPVLNTKAHKQGCCSASDAADARRVADMLDIPFHALNFKDAFGRIKDYFADEYLAGRTPNPCVMCNNWLKFGKLWEFAESVGASYISTGHYAQLKSVPGEEQPALVRGLDRSKDQSYVLFGINRDLLDKIIFPVGGFVKPEIREMAGEAGLRTANKPDSQEICFIPDNDYFGFLNRYRGEQETAGEMVDTAGNVVGQHTGYENYTIGQRKRLGVAFGSPRYVIKIEPETKRVVIGTRDDLARKSLEANRSNWLIDSPGSELRCQAQIRYQHKEADCTVQILDEERFRVTFDNPEYGVAPGQAVVLYDADRVIGGGWIM
ncbi:tRNA 2-thiouridine(34) synthase MnmA [Gimesia chilikensis]|uniref:tRNA 2-thiouridine(34) synthase MnmA n=1 Tax=Gimesia chilikensis TaxID=2605989 RepID=UPI0011EFFB5F|nr:tRNA 2-thiouridine(34) synthase MnmA [Gimesia chilikensis]KAA0137941.1 tRNA 2-thiouridine(34) synthase MnmA [Gimesia chilikensis]